MMSYRVIVFIVRARLVWHHHWLGGPSTSYIYTDQSQMLQLSKGEGLLRQSHGPPSCVSSGLRAWQKAYRDSTILFVKSLHAAQSCLPIAKLKIWLLTCLQKPCQNIKQWHIPPLWACIMCAGVYCKSPSRAWPLILFEGHFIFFFYYCKKAH